MPQTLIIAPLRIISMAFKLSRLSPKSILHQIDKKYPRFKAFREDPKVQKIASQVFKAALCIGCGAGLGFVLATPLGVNIFVGIAIGAGFGAFCYVAVTGVKFILEEYGFPANKYRICPPLNKDKWFSNKNYKEFQKAFTTISKLDGFNSWKQAKNIRSNAKAEEKLWKECQKGFCHSEAQNLISLLRENHSLKGAKLLDTIEAEGLFERQLHEIIRRDLSSNVEIAKLAKTLPNAEEFLEKSFTKHELFTNSQLLSDLTSQLKPSKDHQAIGLTLRLQNNTSDSHTLFVQLEPVFRFYDPYNPAFTGIYEGFKTPQECLQTLQKHLKGYHSKTRPTALKFDRLTLHAYRIDCPEIREEEQLVTAGANPLLQ